MSENSVMSESKLTDPASVMAALNAVNTYIDENYSAGNDPRKYLVEIMRGTMNGEPYGLRLGLDGRHVDGVLSEAGDLIRAGALAQARDRIMLAILLDPLDQRAFYALGATLQLEGRHLDAIRAYAFYAQSNIDDPAVYLRLGECVIAAGAYEAAREYLEAAIEAAEEREDASSRQHAQKLLEMIDNLPPRADA